MKIEKSGFYAFSGAHTKYSDGGFMDTIEENGVLTLPSPLQLGRILPGSSSFTSLIRGLGNPNGVVIGSVGDLYLRSDGGPGSTLWIKESGNGTNTGWAAK